MISLYRGPILGSRFVQVRLLPASLKPAIGKKAEGQGNVNDAPIRVDREPDYEGRENCDVLLKSQVNEVFQRFAEIQWNPLKPRVYVPNHLRDFSEALSAHRTRQ